MKKVFTSYIALLFIIILSSCTNILSSPRKKGLEYKFDSDTSSFITRSIKRSNYNDDVVLNVNYGVANSNNQITTSKNKNVVLKDLENTPLIIEDLPFDIQLFFYVDISINNATVYKTRSSLFTLTEDNPTINLDLQLSEVKGKITYSSPYTDSSLFYPSMYSINSNTPLPVLNKQGVRFDGWYLSKNFAGNPISRLTGSIFQGDITLYGKFSLLPVDIKIDSINSEGNKEIDLSSKIELVSSVLDANVYYTTDNSDPLNSSNPNRKLYTTPLIFEGELAKLGETSEGLTLKYYSEKEGLISSEVKTVNYKMNTYTVSFDNKGKGNSVESQTLKKGEKVSNVGSLTQTGYLFNGWYSSPNLSPSSSWNFDNNTISSDITLYASWEPITYDVVFHKNDGSAETSRQTFTYDAEQNLTAMMFTRDGWGFKEWNTNKNGSGTSYLDNALISTPLCENNGDEYNLYAIWKDIKAPGEVSGLSSMADNDGTSVSLSWTNPGDSDFDKVVITYGEGNKVEILKSQSPNDSYKLQNLTSGEKIEVKVQTVDNAEEPNTSSGKIVYAFPNTPYELTPLAYLTIEGDKMKMGDYPQTIKDKDVKITSTTKEFNKITYYLGSDNNYYSKVTNPKICSEGNHYFSDGTYASSGEIYYFKLESIYWTLIDRVNHVWVADKALLGGSYSSIYTNDLLNSSFKTQAFPSEMINQLKTQGDGKAVSLLKKNELLGCFPDENATDYNRVRKPTDYALATGIYKDNGNDNACWWWLRDESGSDVQCVAPPGDVHLTNSASNTDGGVVPSIQLYN